MGKHFTLDYFVGETEKADARVTLGHYTIYRDMAADITAGRYDRAKCSAELSASSMLDDVRACLGNQECRASLEKEARQHAPEALGEAPLAFGYIASKDGIRYCGDNPPKVIRKR